MYIRNHLFISKGYSRSKLFIAWEMWVSYVHLLFAKHGYSWYKAGMSELVEQLQLPTEYSAETLYIKEMKEILAAAPEEKGDRLCMTFKISRDRHAELLKAVGRHDMTITDILTLHIDRIIPVLQKAKKVERARLQERQAPTTGEGREEAKRRGKGKMVCGVSQKSFMRASRGSI